MDHFKEASRIKLRIQTPYGLLNVEQLWDLSLSKISTSIKTIKQNLQKDDVDADTDLSFLDDTKVIDKESQLSFEILKDIYLTKKQEMESQKIASDNKNKNDKIMSIIYQKQETELASKTIDELKSLLV